MTRCNERLMPGFRCSLPAGHEGDHSNLVDGIGVIALGSARKPTAKDASSDAEFIDMLDRVSRGGP